MRAAYEYSYFRYVSYLVGTTSYAGNRIPGVPEQALTATVGYHIGEVSFSSTVDLATPMYADDANSAKAPGRAIFGLAVGREVRVAGTRLTPLVPAEPGSPAQGKR